MAAVVVSLGVCLLSSLVVSVHGYAEGAPTSTCTSMEPGHGSRQSSTIPFSITSVATDNTNTVFTVTLVGQYQGLFVQARKSDGSSSTPLGTFSNAPSNTKLITCSATADSWTHSNQNTKNSASVTWTAPAGGAANIIFRATVNQAKDTWWYINGSQKINLSGLMCFMVLILALIQI